MEWEWIRKRNEDTISVLPDSHQFKCLNACMFLLEVHACVWDMHMDVDMDLWMSKQL
jgi:hypothetical protein